MVVHIDDKLIELWSRNDAWPIKTIPLINTIDLEQVKVWDRWENWLMGFHVEKQPQDESISSRSSYCCGSSSRDSSASHSVDLEIGC